MKKTVDKPYPILYTSDILKKEGEYYELFT